MVLTVGATARLVLPAALVAATALPLACATAAPAAPSLTLAQEVGQVLMIGAPSTKVDPSVVALIGRDHLGGVVLIGKSTRGVAATRKIADALHAADTIPPIVAVDQEGGQVQHLQGSGFSRMPSALTMGTWKPATVRAGAATWGGQLKQAGVDLDLAPVLDTVPAWLGKRNAPIGAFDREFGTTPTVVKNHGRAFELGMMDAGRLTALKHFPGLGRVKGNTDTTGNVTDTVTTRTDPYLAPFQAGVEAGSAFVLISSATYTRIDPANPAVFSRTIITGMLRHDLGFTGVVVSDSLSAVEVKGVSPAQRAIRFVKAGGDMALATSTADVSRMYEALLAKAGRQPSFRKLIDAAVQRIVKAKEQAGLM